MTQPTIELLPCPFCGGSAEMRDNGIGDYYVKCFVCEAAMSDYRCEEPKHAAGRWNRRAALQQQAQGGGGWWPIDTAPKDRRVLVWTGKNIYVANWVKNIISDHEAFMICDTGVPGYRVIVEPTHWKECPEQPAISATKDGA